MIWEVGGIKSWQATPLRRIGLPLQYRKYLAESYNSASSA